LADDEREELDEVVRYRGIRHADEAADRAGDPRHAPGVRHPAGQRPEVRPDLLLDLRRHGPRRDEGLLPLDRRQQRRRPHGCDRYSHSIVAGGFDEMSYTTRFTPDTSLMMRLESRASKSSGRRAQSAVMPSVDCTARIASTYSYVRSSPM